MAIELAEIPFNSVVVYLSLDSRARYKTRSSDFQFAHDISMNWVFPSYHCLISFSNLFRRTFVLLPLTRPWHFARRCHPYYGFSHGTRKYMYSLFVDLGLLDQSLLQYVLQGCTVNELQ